MRARLSGISQLQSRDRKDADFCQRLPISKSIVLSGLIVVKIELGVLNLSERRAYTVFKAVLGFVFAGVQS